MNGVSGWVARTVSFVVRMILVRMVWETVRRLFLRR